MAIETIVDGPALIRVDVGAGLVDLGYCYDSVQVFEDVYTEEVFSDERGGPEGRPIDEQYLGEIHRLVMDFSRFDNSVMDSVRPKRKGGTAGQEGTAGSLYIAGSLSYRLLILPTNRPRNYLAAIPITSWEVNKGTKYSRQRVEWKCFPVSGVLYNTTTS